jgi:energy-coupling factor transport system permease protein
VSAVPAAIVLAALAVAALLAENIASAAVLAAVLLGVCIRGAGRRGTVYLAVALTGGLSMFILSPFLQVTGASVLWSGPSVPVLGTLDVTWEELEIAAVNALRLSAVVLAFAAYALVLDHDRLLAAFGFARRSSLAVALATRLVPTLERDAAGLKEALRGRGVVVEGVRGHARLLSPVVAGSLERAANLAEAMEARGYGRRESTRAPRPTWSHLDRLAVAAAVAIVAVGAMWL